MPDQQPQLASSSPGLERAWECREHERSAPTLEFSISSVCLSLRVVAAWRPGYDAFVGLSVAYGCTPRWL